MLLIESNKLRSRRGAHDATIGQNVDLLTVGMDELRAQRGPVRAARIPAPGLPQRSSAGPPQKAGVPLAGSVGDER